LRGVGPGLESHAGIGVLERLSAALLLRRGDSAGAPGVAPATAPVPEPAPAPALRWASAEL
jgi:hypothetical protein